MKHCISSLVVACLFLLTVARADDEAVIRSLQKAGATIERDESNVDKPVVRVKYNLRQVTDEGILAIRELEDLPAIEFIGTGDSEITVATLRALRGKDSLKRFVIRYAKISDEAASILGTLKSLKALDLQVQIEMSPKGLSEVFKLTNLRELTLSDRLVSEDVMQGLASLPALKDLTLRSVFVTDQCIASLKQYRSLKTLRIFLGANVTFAGLRQLAALQLPQVEISYFNVKDADLKELRKIEGLTVLRLMNARNLTDAAIPYLSDMTELRELEITGGQLAKPKVEELKKALFNCKITEGIL